MDVDVRAINEKIERESAFVDLLTSEMNKVIVGQKYMIERLLIGLLGNGHILLEGVPGLAKTLAINDQVIIKLEIFKDQPAEIINIIQKKDSQSILLRLLDSSHTIWVDKSLVEFQDS